MSGWITISVLLHFGAGLFWIIASVIGSQQTKRLQEQLRPETDEALEDAREAVALSKRRYDAAAKNANQIAHEHWSAYVDTVTRGGRR